MASISNFTRLDTKLEQDGLKINKRMHRIDAKLSAFQYIDKDTNQHIIYVPSLDISGYGNTIKRAEEMVKFLLDQIAMDLLQMSSDKLAKELASLGWKRNPFRNKEYSKVFIDKNGELKSFNAEGEIKQITIVA